MAYLRGYFTLGSNFDSNIVNFEFNKSTKNILGRVPDVIFNSFDFVKKTSGLSVGINMQTLLMILSFGQNANSMKIVSKGYLM